MKSSLQLIFRVYDLSRGIMTNYFYIKEGLLILSSVGSSLAGVGVFILLKDYISRKKRDYETSYWERISRTFYYVNRLGSFDNNFLNIYNYLEFKRYRNNPPQPLSFFELSPTGLMPIQITDSNADFTVRKYLIEIYRFLKEIDLLISDQRSRALVDQHILIESFSSYRIDINNFFTAAFQFVSTIAISFGQISGLRGDFTRENLVELNTSLRQWFDFIS